MDDPSSFEDLLPEISQLAGRLGLQLDEPNDPSGVLDALRKQLIDRITALLAHQGELLMSLLYRADVDEGLVVDAFRTLGPDDLAPRLADLIIERQVQKVRTRRQYRQNKS